jgi:hypothetical protein
VLRENAASSSSRPRVRAGALLAAGAAGRGAPAPALGRGALRALAGARPHRLVNWDLLAVALVAGALLAWSRDRPVLTGVLIGLGTATKLYPLFLLGGIAVICLRSAPADFAAPVSGGGAGLAGQPARRYLTGWDEWKHFWSFNSERGADLGRLWLVLSQAGVRRSTRHWSTGGRWLVFGAWCVVVLVHRLLARRRRRGWRSSASSSSPASCSSTRSTRRSTSSGCCRWPCWPGRAGATSSSGRPASSSTSPASGGTSTASWRPGGGTDAGLLLGGDRRAGRRRALPRRDRGPRHPTCSRYPADLLWTAVRPTAGSIAAQLTLDWRSNGAVAV